MESPILTLFLLILGAFVVWALVARSKSTRTPRDTNGSKANSYAVAKETSQEWSYLVNDPNMVVLDTETSGLPPNAEVIDVAVIDAEGNTLFEALSLPSGSISRKATEIHGLTKTIIRKRGYQPWTTIHDELARIVSAASRVVSYNASFDREVLNYTSELHGMSFPTIRWYDAMSTYVGLDYQFVKLEEAIEWEGLPLERAHSAIGDARMTLALIKAVVDRQANGREIPAQLRAHRSGNRLFSTGNSGSSTPATEKQIGFIYILLDERDVPVSREADISREIEAMTKEEASKTIEYLLNRPRL